MRILIIDEDNSSEVFNREVPPVEMDSEVFIVKDRDQATRLLSGESPDVAVLNCSLPEKDARLFCEKLKKRFNSLTHVLVHSNGVLREWNFDESGFTVNTSAIPDELMGLITQGLHRPLREQVNPITSRSGIHTRLTDRQMDVLRLMSEGLSNEEIASSLNIALGTVKLHVNRILSKLEVKNRTKAAVKAAQLGLLKL